MASDNRLWTHKKLRDWLKKVNLPLPRGSLVAPLNDGDGHYLVTLFQGIRGIPPLGQEIVIAVRHVGGFAKISYEDERIGAVSIEIDMHKTTIDRLENAQLSLRLEGDV